MAQLYSAPSVRWNAEFIWNRFEWQHPGDQFGGPNGRLLAGKRLIPLPIAVIDPDEPGTVGIRQITTLSGPSSTSASRQIPFSGKSNVPKPSPQTELDRDQVATRAKTRSQWLLQLHRR